MILLYAIFAFGVITKVVVLTLCIISPFWWAINVLSNSETNIITKFLTCLIGCTLLFYGLANPAYQRAYAIYLGHTCELEKVESWCCTEDEYIDPQTGWVCLAQEECLVDACVIDGKEIITDRLW